MPTDQSYTLRPPRRSFNRPGGNLFEIVEKLLHDGIVRRYHYRAQCEPREKVAIEIKSVTNQRSGLPRNRLKHMTAIDTATVNRVEGELDQLARNVRGARVADVSVTATRSLGKRSV